MMPLVKADGKAELALLEQLTSRSGEVDPSSDRRRFRHFGCGSLPRRRCFKGIHAAVRWRGSGSGAG